ncbi:CYTH domain-containing protein [Kushneria indalinina]|uniref:CYTH domain-containing protein n=1 Tax=Kushneria indalinina DSM 14324 TaxID=1122140 RepID=A0A3D9DXX5_9GAMM|nr:CYTH domain-containing protein [Kushneria indalinina]REC95551.1 CYTH domain-containing protein [Kushneria indalinina DSM 14324]
MNSSTQSDNTVTNATNGPQEVELKLALGRDSVDALMAHPLLTDTPPETHRLANVYYDTPELALEAHRVALRLRGDGQTFVQTVKTAGDGQGGLHTRGEWETPRSEERLDLEWLAGLGVTPFENSEVREALQGVYRTDFQRTQWLLKHEGSHIELALDIGKIRVGEQQVDIHEIELELKDGEESALWSLADQLAQHCALRPANASKAARAASLREQQWQLPPCALDMPDQCLERAILALDAWQDSQQQAFLYAARQTLLNLTRHDDPEVATLAGRLGESLSRPGWLDVRFGQQWLLLMQRLYRQ